MRQEAKIAGDGNTIVQIVGDGNSVVLDHPHLTLTRYVSRRAVREELDWLSPYTQSTTLVGRSTEVASLESFLSDLRPMLVRVLVGNAGCGKTRLALHLCEQASGKGWYAGFVGRNELKRALERQNMSDWGWNRPTLIAVDYAAEHASLLRDWLDELADRAVRPKEPLRLLFLERSASTETGWWTTVFASGGYGASSKRALLDPIGPVRIQPLLRVEDRLTVLGEMLLKADPSGTLASPANEPTLNSKVLQLSWGGEPLFLMMAALEMVRVSYAKVLTLSRADLAVGLAVRELDRLSRLATARSLNPALVWHMAACTTLAQGLDRQDFEHFATIEKNAIGMPTGADPADLADLLQELYPRRAGIGAIVPDAIGEAVLLRTLQHDTGRSAVLRCHATFGHAVAESVIRCAQDLGEHSAAPLEWLTAIVGAVEGDEEALSALDASMPFDSVTLADVSVAVAKRLCELRVRRGADASSRGSALVGLAIRLARTGDSEAALRANQEAVDLYRKLAAAEPEEFLPDLARSLNNLALNLSDRERHAEALQAAQEAIDLYRKLAAGGARELRSGLAGSLNNLFIVLSRSNRPAPALRAAKEAADLYRELAAKEPDRFRAELSCTLNNLCIGHRGLSQFQQAFRAIQEAVEIRRELNALHPDMYRFELAKSLGRLADVLHNLKEYEAALRADQDTVTVRRELAAQRPDRFRAYLATSLCDLSISLAKLSQREGALKAAEEAVDVYRELAKQSPDQYRVALAESLNVLADRLVELERRESALQAAREGIVALRPDLLGRSHVPLMEALVRTYTKMCELIGQPIDNPLLRPVHRRLDDFIDD